MCSSDLVIISVETIPVYPGEDVQHLLACGWVGPDRLETPALIKCRQHDNRRYLFTVYCQPAAVAQQLDLVAYSVL